MGEKGCGAVGGSIGALEAELEAVTKEWKSLPLQTGAQKMAAAQFYDEKVFPLSKEVFIAKHASLIKDPIYGLILSVGTSPEPLIFSISVIKPEKVLFLCTEQSEPCLDKIVAETGLAPRQWEKQIIDRANPLYIYREIRDAWVRWGRRHDVAVDITGGTKSMSGGAAMAAGIIGARLLYVNSRYVPDRRQPDPGTEHLGFLPNPYDVFGDIEEHAAKDRFCRHDYSGAWVILDELSKKAPSPKRYEALKLVAQAYEAWDDLDIKGTCQYLNEAITRLKLLREQGIDSLTFSLDELVDTLQQQCGILQHLADRLPLDEKTSTLPLLTDAAAVKSLIFTVYNNAERKEERGEFDTAALLLYRLLEILEQRRLATYGIDTAAPDYSRIANGDKQKLLDAVNHIKESLKQEKLPELPKQIALVEGYMLLEALHDSFTLPAAKVKWKGFLSQIEARNNSVLAHGFVFISKKQSGDFKKMVNRLLDLFCLIEGIDRQTACEECRFINPWPGD